MATECRKQWDLVIQSGRAFGMPALQIGRLQWDGKPQAQNVYLAGYVQKLTGETNLTEQAIQGFAKKDDAALYKLDVVTPAKYYVFLKGVNLNKCGSIELLLANKMTTGQLTPTGDLSFGEVDINKSDIQLILKCTTNSLTADKATVTQLVFSRNNNAGSPYREKTRIE